MRIKTKMELTWEQYQKVLRADEQELTPEMKQAIQKFIMDVKKVQHKFKSVELD